MMGLWGLWQRCEREGFGGGHLSWVFSVSKTFQPSMESQYSISKLIEHLLCLLPVFSSDIPWDGGDGDQKEVFPFPHHAVKYRSCCDGT